MYWVYDADSHVEEGEFTFQDKYWDQRYRGRRPIVVQADDLGNLCWMVDSHSFPRLMGPSPATGGNPNSKDGIPSREFPDRVVGGAAKGMEVTLAGMEFHTTASRLAMMDLAGIAVQVNFPTILLTWPFAHDPKIGCAVARSYNNHMADIAGGAPDRLKWITAIDPSDVDEAVREVRRCRNMGSVGLMLLGTYGDRHLDHPSLDPIWKTCAELEMPIAVHPGFCDSGLDKQYTQVYDAFMVPFVFSVLLGYYSVIRSGLLDRYPNLRVGFMETGARWVDFMTMRLHENSGRESERNPHVQWETAAMDEADVGGHDHIRPGFGYQALHSAEHYIERDQVFVNCEVDEEQLPFVVDNYGDDFLLFAGDMWHGHNVANPQQALLARTDLREQTKRKILVDNVARFYGLPVPKEVPKPVASGD